MTVTKAGLIDTICESCDFLKNLSTTTVESLLETMKKALEGGEDIMISGFGKFCVKDKKERRGRSPHTGEDLMLGGRRVMTFKAALKKYKGKKAARIYESLDKKPSR